MSKGLLLLSTLLALAVPAAGARAATSHTVDLANGLPDGHRVLGRTIAGVTAGLGRPDFRLGPRSRYRIGWGSPTDFSIEVVFHRSGGVQYAWSIVFRHVAVRDVKIGDLLGRRSRSLQAAIVAGYGDIFRLLRPYACTSRGVCVGEFAPVGGPLHLTFGTYPRLGNWLTVWQKPAGARPRLDAFTLRPPPSRR